MKKIYFIKLKLTILLISNPVFRILLIGFILAMCVDTQLWGQRTDLGVNPSEAKLSAQKVIWSHKVKKVNFAEVNSPELFESYRATLCVIPMSAALPKDIGKQCIRTYIGSLLPSAMYMRVEAGGVRMIQVANGGTGWQITNLPAQPISSDTKQKIVKLDAQQYDTLKEQAQHSLIALYGILNSNDQKNLEKLKFATDSSHLIIKWLDGLSENDFFFNKQSLICEKQVRTVIAGTSILKYYDYKKINGVRLPYRVELSSEAGKVMGVQEIEKWELGVLWSKDFFTPEGVRRDF